MNIKPVLRKISTIVSRPVLVWTEPTGTTITKVYIYSSTTKNGVYTEVTNIDATSDGLAKSSSNSWVITYTDSTGSATNWYKIKFYDGTDYSEYSNALTCHDRERLCSVTDVKKVLETTGRWTDEEVYDVIESVEESVYDDFGKPISAVVSSVGKIDSVYQKKYYVGEAPIYRVDRLFYGTATKTELFFDDGFTYNPNMGMVKVNTSASGVTFASNIEFEIQFVPKIINDYVKYKAAESLLEKTDTTNGGDVSKELSVIQSRLSSIESRMANKYCFAIPDQFKDYDARYGVNSKTLLQDHRRNKYLAPDNDEGWL